MNRPRSLHGNSGGVRICVECRELRVQALIFTNFASPETYPPKHLAEKILASNSALEGERKQLAVLFPDMKGTKELFAAHVREDGRKHSDAVSEPMEELI